MFERFSDRARQVVVRAQDEARLLKHGYIGTEHLLVGLLSVEDGVAAKVLASRDVQIEEVRTLIFQIVGEGEGPETTGQIPFTPRSKKVLELALREALSLGANTIGTEHILLGLARESEGVAARILLEFDLDGTTLRDATLSFMDSPGYDSPPPPHGRRRMRRRWEYRVEEGEANVEALGELGREGWELAAAQGDKLIFKRPR